MALHGICQGWRGRQALGLARCPTRQEGGGSNLQPPEVLSPARLGLSSGVGWYPGHLSLRGWTRRHLQCEEGPFCEISVLAARRDEASGTLAPRGPPRRCSQLVPSTWAWSSILSPQNQGKGLSPASEGSKWDQSLPLSLLPVQASDGGTRMGPKGGPMSPRSLNSCAREGRGAPGGGPCNVGEEGEARTAASPVQTPKNWNMCVPRGGRGGASTRGHRPGPWAKANLKLRPSELPSRCREGAWAPSPRRRRRFRVGEGRQEAPRASGLQPAKTASHAHLCESPYAALPPQARRTPQNPERSSSR